MKTLMAAPESDTRKSVLLGRVRRIFSSAERNAGKASQRLVAMGLAAGLPSPPRGARDFKVLSIGILPAAVLATAGMHVPPAA